MSIGHLESQWLVGPNVLKSSQSVDRPAVAASSYYLPATFATRAGKSTVFRSFKHCLLAKRSVTVARIVGSGSVFLMFAAIKLPWRSSGVLLPNPQVFGQNEVYEFGPFRLDRQKRQLVRGDEVVSLTPRVFEILFVLVENHTRVVPKAELMKAVWPDSFVQEANLAQNICVLRKALGDCSRQPRYIATLPSLGYKFTESVRRVLADNECSTSPADRLSAQLATPRRRQKLFWVGVVLSLVLLLGCGASLLISQGPSGMVQEGILPTR